MAAPSFTGWKRRLPQAPIDALQQMRRGNMGRSFGPDLMPRNIFNSL
jgi:hypothetical protein